MEDLNIEFTIEGPKELRFQVRGLVPLMMHNPQLADPMCEWTKRVKQVSSKRKKTDEDHLLLRKLEWFGGLYFNADGQLWIPPDAIDATVVNGAKRNKLGTLFESCVYCSHSEPLEYEGPRDLEAMYADGRFVDYRGVVVNRSRVMRARPIIRQWQATFNITYDPSVANESQVIQAVQLAGQYVGFLEMRPKLGKFMVTRIQRTTGGNDQPATTRARNTRQRGHDPVANGRAVCVGAEGD